ncbi:hypothetical protein [Bauldia litoralis]|uniref:hypothetical protein n=1 Tax=Bauldia litoralis TaxID=665467 RepID=UPI0032664A58
MTTQPKPLVELLEELRAQLGPEDTISLCRDGSQRRCTHRCPGPCELGSVCLEIEADDPRSSQEIACQLTGPN